MPGSRCVYCEALTGRPRLNGPQCAAEPCRHTQPASAPTPATNGAANGAATPAAGAAVDGAAAAGGAATAAPAAGATCPEGFIYADFDPLLLRQKAGQRHLEFGTFDAALDEFYSKVGPSMSD